MSQTLRSGLVTGATLIQFVVGALWLGVEVLLLWLMRAPEMRAVADSHAAVWGLEVAAGILAPFALLALAGGSLRDGAE